MIIKCSYCDSKAKKINYVFESDKVNPRTGSLIRISDASYMECGNCSHTWMTEDQEAHLRLEEAKQSRYQLNAEQIKTLREGLPFSTKKGVADFLCLNPKAFTHWEKGSGVPNDAYDLLLRLAARSQENIDFIKQLHDNHFAFDPKDYHVIVPRFTTKANYVPREVVRSLYLKEVSGFKKSAYRSDYIGIGNVQTTNHVKIA